MPWNTRNSRVRRVEEQLQRVGPASVEEREDLRRRVAVAELAAAACVVHACGRDVGETAAGFTKLTAFPRAEWAALFDEARAGVRRQSSDRDWPARSAVLEQLIDAVQGHSGLPVETC